MPCDVVKFGDGTVAIFCGPKLYKFNDWFFEWHSYCGPCPLKKNGETRKRAGRKFWKVVDEFQKLSDKQKEEYRA